MSEFDYFDEDCAVQAMLACEPKGALCSEYDRCYSRDKAECEWCLASGDVDVPVDSQKVAPNATLHEWIGDDAVREALDDIRKNYRWASCYEQFAIVEAALADRETLAREAEVAAVWIRDRDKECERLRERLDNGGSAIASALGIMGELNDPAFVRVPREVLELDARNGSDTAAYYLREYGGAK